jgi:hypothetical protein
MPARPKKPPPKSPRQRMQARRERLRAEGLRPVQRWVPDLRDPKVREEIRREAHLLAQHPDNASVDDWIDAVVDWSEWT